MLALTFGDEEQVARASRRILAIHDRIHGSLESRVGRFPAGTPYSAHDPALLLWVHATLLDSILLFYGNLIEPLTTVERDEYLDAAAMGMTRIGLPASRAPRDTGSLAAYLDGVMASGQLAVSSTSKALANAVLSPSSGWMLFPVIRAQRLMTIGTLPTPIRELYGYRWSPARQRMLSRTIALVRRLRAVAPDAVAKWAQARD
jgi:uncharacterized protein (DUF2236 family)